MTDAEKAAQDEANAQKEAVAKAEQERADALAKAEAAEKTLADRDAALIKSAVALLKGSNSDTAKEAAEALEAKLEGKTIEKSNGSTAAEVAEVFKAQMPELVKSISEPLTKALNDTKAELEEVKKSNAMLVGERTEREITEIAKSLVGEYEANIEHVRLMKSQLSPEGFSAFVKREQENSAAIRKSPLFRELGTNTGGESKSDDPYKQLNDIANSIIQKSDGKLSFADAFGMATAERPDLYDAYRTGAYANNANRED